MPFFSYKARDVHGELIQGVLEGADSGAVATQLLNSGITPLSITATTRTRSDDEGGWWSRLTEQKIRTVDVQLFSRQLYTLLKAGVPIMRGLAGLQESAVNKSLGRVIKDLRESLESGRELSASMRGHPEVFDAFYISMVRVGEMTGRMEEIFLRLNDHLEFESEMKDRVRSALRYPTFVVIAMIAAITIVNIWVVPTFAKVFAGFNAELPLMTRILIGFSNFTVAYWPHITAAAICFAFAMRAYIGTANGRYKWDRVKLRLPVAGKIMLKGTLARFARSFSLTGRSGVPIVQGLSVVAQTADNAYVRARIEQMRNGVERGETILRTAAATGVFTPVVLQMIAVGEETGELDELMVEIADMYEREVEYELTTLSTQIEPILITGLAILVLILALGVFLPIWDLGQASLK